MKIAITGAHGVGKTTLAEKLLEHLPVYDLRPEPYYELQELGYEFSETPNTDDFAEQLNYSIKQITASSDNVIFDRCPVDIMAYLEALNGIHYINTMYDKAESAMEDIDLIIFVPIEEPDIITYQKSDYPELRDAVNEILKESVYDFGIEVIEVKGSLDQRVRQVRAKIS
ncbi:ATP-binding protein [Flavobacterium sp. AG291]|uniref:ATP/GTP-binding protein n=1 Tax=Flavobacterium sp. AG291 TaxID=2184000 RepID=UPI000E0C5B8A|nr:ATP-binding protein [Flavobacterium sp. AG291]RDI07016.1 putative ATPase [Flavobacterium sp. AG291]